MSTPIKLRALSPKILQTLSPINKNVFDFNHLTPISSKSPNRSAPNVTKLHIPSSIQKTSGAINKFNTSSPLITFNLIDDDRERNRFFDALNINSPEKLQIQEEGLDLRKDLNVLGRGRFGTVIKGFYRGRIVAVKVVKLSPFNGNTINETNALILLNDNVVKTIDVVLNKSLNYAIILMEYLANYNNLHNVLDNVKLSRCDCIKFAIDICKGLSYCHIKSVYHMDLKPKNILISADGICKLCDFGNSYRDGWSVDYVHQGTVAYTAPEILIGRLPTAKCDVYSLGIILWQMKSGRMPYEKFTAKEMLIYKVVKFNVRPDDDDAIIGNDADIFNVTYRNCWRSDPIERPTILNVLLVLSDM